MSSQFIERFYQECMPEKRLACLEKSIQSGEEPELNVIRQELCNMRYDKLPKNAEQRPDNFFKFWMMLEYNRNAASRFRGIAKAKKEIKKALDEFHFSELCSKSEQHRELLYQECCHLVRCYMEISIEDRAYNSTFLGIMGMSKEQSKAKLTKDIYETAVQLPKEIGMTEELQFFTKAAREVFGEFYPNEELPE